MYTYDMVKASMPKEKATRDSIWAKIFLRPIAYPLSVLALNLGLTPNMISILAIINIIISCIFLSMNFQIINIIGLLLLNFFGILDCIDGTMARTLKKNSYMGEFYDALGGYTICAFSLLAIAICACQSGRVVLINSHFLIILIGAIGSICDIFSRLIYQKYTANVIMAEAKKGHSVYRENDSFYTVKPNLSIHYLRLEIDRQFGVGGLFPPLVIVAYIFRLLDIFLLVYAIYHALACIIIMILFCRKATLYDYIG